MYFKLTLKIFLSILLAVVLLFLAMLFISDPFQIYHKPILGTHQGIKTSLVGDAYPVVKHLIDNKDFDSVIIGSSTSVNIPADETSNKLGGKFLNLSISGTNEYEERFILKYLYNKKHTIKKMVYFVNYYGSYRIYNEFSNKINWKQLYDNNPFNDIEIYFSRRNINCIFTFDNPRYCYGNYVANFNAPFTWINDFPFSSKFGSYSVWLKNYKIDGHLTQNLDDIALDKVKHYAAYSSKGNEIYMQQVRQYYDKNFFYFVKKHPETQFYMVIPPTATLGWAETIKNNNNYFLRQKDMLKFFVEKSMKYKNFKVYFFDNIPEVGNIENFRDFVHYSPKIDNLIINSIRENKNILTLNEIDPYFEGIIKRAQNINYAYYVKKAQETVKKYQ